MLFDARERTAQFCINIKFLSVSLSIFRFFHFLAFVWSPLMYYFWLLFRHLFSFQFIHHYRFSIFSSKSSLVVRNRQQHNRYKQPPNNKWEKKTFLRLLVLFGFYYAKTCYHFWHIDFVLFMAAAAAAAMEKKKSNINSISYDCTIACAIRNGCMFILKRKQRKEQTNEMKTENGKSNKKLQFLSSLEYYPFSFLFHVIFF